MKRSRAVPIPLLSTVAAAALAAGCGSSHPAQPVQSAQAQGWQTCVERSGNTAVEQRYCDDEAVRPPVTGYVPHYGWYYYPYSYYWTAPLFGSPVPVGGTFGPQPFASAPMARTGAVVRGGFGSSAAGHASGGE